MFYYLIPLISALIGWATNKIALKMLFYPRKPILGIQGLIPKRKEKLAKKIGEIVEKELLSLDDIIKNVNKEELYIFLFNKIESLLIEKFPIISSLVPEETKKELFNSLIRGILTEIKNTDNINELFSISITIEEKINKFDVTKLELIVKDVARKEFRSIEVCGLLLGFFIGLLQIILLKVL